MSGKRTVEEPHRLARVVAMLLLVAIVAVVVGVLVWQMGWFGGSSGGSSPSSVPGSAPSSTSGGAPSPNAPASGAPSSTPNQGGENGDGERATFRVKNSCPFDVWVEARATMMRPGTGNPSSGNFSLDAADWIAGAPLSPSFEKPPKVASGSFVDIPVQKDYPWGVAGGRIWAKVGCDSQGSNCVVGDSSQYWGGWDNPNNGCPTGGCTPPIESSLEFTTGCSLEDRSKCSPNPADFSQKLGPTTYYDVSHVNGWTLPYSLRMTGDASKCNCDAQTGVCSGAQPVDASKLDVAQCPTKEDLSLPGTKFAGTVPLPLSNPPIDPATGKAYDLSGVDLRFAAQGKVYGCYAPQTKLANGPPFGMGQNISLANGPVSMPLVAMACPTPLPCGSAPVGSPCPNDPTGTCLDSGVCSSCTFDNACTSSASCNAGPGPLGDGRGKGDGVTATQYVQTVHRLVPGVYAFAYDDAVGLSSCPTDVGYEWELCPAGSAAYPGDLSPSPA